MLLSYAASRIRRSMKKRDPSTGGPEQEANTPAQKDPTGSTTADAAIHDTGTCEAAARQGRSGEGAHSAMKHWLHEERHRIKRPEH